VVPRHAQNFFLRDVSQHLFSPGSVPASTWQRLGAQRVGSVEVSFAL
jgi:hypothetical protein